MSNTPHSYTRIFATLTVTWFVAAFTAQPAAAQNATNLRCNGCVDGKDIRNNSIRRNDVRNNAITGAKVRNNSLTGSDIRDNSIGLGDLGFDPATQQELDNTDTLGDLTCNEGQVAKIVSGAWTCAADVDSAGDIGLLMTKIDNLAHLQASGASAYVFLTSETYTGDLGGVAGADDKCQTLADQAGLPGIYRAWIADSTSGSAPAFRFTQAPSRYISPPSVPLGPPRIIAISWAELIDGILDMPIDVDESGAPIPNFNFAWTNVTTAGFVNVAGVNGRHCLNWTASDSSLRGDVGLASTFDLGWTQAGSDRCDRNNHLYCFGQ